MENNFFFFFLNFTDTADDVVDKSLLSCIDETGDDDDNVDDEEDHEEKENVHEKEKGDNESVEKVKLKSELIDR